MGLASSPQSHFALRTPEDSMSSSYHKCRSVGAIAWGSVMSTNRTLVTREAEFLLIPNYMSSVYLIDYNFKIDSYCLHLKQMSSPIL